MMELNPYLTFNGDCADAFRYYEKHLGGKINFISTFGDGPPDMPVDPSQKDWVMHATMQIGATTIMASDAPGGRYERPQGMSVSIQLSDPQEAERIFAALADGGVVTMPLEKTFWAERFGMTTDRFGTPWMINCLGAKS